MHLSVTRLLKHACGYTAANEVSQPMFRRRKTEGQPDQRLTELERVIDLQGYVMCIIGVIAGIAVGVAAVLFQQTGEVDFDHIAVALTIFQTLFGIAAIYGFWALRGLTRDRAEEVAKEVANSVSGTIAVSAAKEAAERIAAAEVREIAPPIILREVKAAMETFRNEGAMSEDTVERMLAAIGGKEEGDG